MFSLIGVIFSYGRRDYCNPCDDDDWNDCKPYKPNYYCEPKKDWCFDEDTNCDWPDFTETVTTYKTTITSSACTSTETVTGCDVSKTTQLLPLTSTDLRVLNTFSTETTTITSTSTVIEVTTIESFLAPSFSSESVAPSKQVVNLENNINSLLNNFVENPQAFNAGVESSVSNVLRKTNFQELDSNALYDAVHQAATEKHLKEGETQFKSKVFDDIKRVKIDPKNIQQYIGKVTSIVDKNKKELGKAVKSICNELKKTGKLDNSFKKATNDSIDNVLTQLKSDLTKNILSVYQNYREALLNDIADIKEGIANLLSEFDVNQQNNTFSNAVFYNADE